MKIFAVVLLLFIFPLRVYALDVSAQSACVIASDSAQIVWAKNEQEKAPMASTTKIMTAILASEYDGWEEQVRISQNAQNQEGSKIYLTAGSSMNLYDLTCGMLLNSGNDAAMAIAEHIGGSSEEFALLMSEKAKKIGAKNTQFKNPNGLDEEGHYSTAYDLALMGRELMNNAELAKIVGTKNMKLDSTDGTQIFLKNHNKMLWNYEGANGIKTGFTKASGRCLVSSAERDGMRLIAVTINAPDDWNDHKKLLDYGFEVCKKQQVIALGEELASERISGTRLGYIACEPVRADCINNRVKECEIVLHRVKQPKPPINKGEKLGEAEVVQNGMVIARIELAADRSIFKQDPEKGGVINKITTFLKKFV